MAEKILNTRIALKYDTLEAWEGSSIVLKPGEVAFAETNGSVLMKVGNNTSWADSKYLAALSADVNSYAKQTDAQFKTTIESWVSAKVQDTDTQYTLVKVNDYQYKLQSKSIGGEFADTGVVIDIPNDTAAISANADAIAALKALVGETSVDAQIDAKIAALDLANTYEAKGAAADALADANEYADGLNTAMDGRMTAVEGDVATLKGTGEGSVAKALADAKAYADTAEADAIASAKEYTDGEVDKVEASLATANEKITALETAVGAGGSVDTQITAKINELDVTDTAVEGQYVSAVSETDGKITVTRANLPDYSETYDAKGAAATAEANAKGYADSLAVNYDAAGSAADALADAKAYTDTEVAKANSAAATAQAAADKAQGEIDALETLHAEDKAALAADIKKNTDAIAVLNGTSEVEGSVDKKVADAINDFAAKVSDDGVVNTYKELIDYAADHGSEFTELVGEVDANTKAIATLNGNASTAGSVDKKIADAIAAENLSQYATDTELSALDTRVGTAEGKITTAEADIDALENKVNALEVTGGQANVIETVKVNGVALTPDASKAVDVVVPTGALASKDKVAEADLESALATKINAKAESSALDALNTKVGDIPTGATATNVVGYVDEKVAALSATHASDKSALEKSITDGDAATLASAKEDATNKANAVDAKLTEYKTANDAAVKANADAVAALETAVGEDSVADQIAAAKGEISTEIDNDVAAAKTELTTAYGNADAALKTELTTAIATAKSEAIADAKTETENQIAALDVTDEAVANQFVTAVSETDGKIAVSRRQLTTDDIAQGVDVLVFDCGGAE